MIYNGFDTLKEALDAHIAWRQDSSKGKRLDLSGANLIGADLSRANLRDANLRGADLGGADLIDGFKWEQYLSELVPALLTAGGKTLAEVVTQSWDCHSWENCPMAVAFGVHEIADIPLLYQREAAFFIQLFDAKQIPNPLAPKTEVPA